MRKLLMAVLAASAMLAARCDRPHGAGPAGERTAQAPPVDPERRRGPLRQAERLQSYRLTCESSVDPDLQAALTSIDESLGARFGIDEADRALGVLDLTDLRLAMVRPDEMFYAASVPKVCILLAYFEAHPEAAEQLPPDVQRELGRMIKVSDNAMAAKYGQLLGIETIQKTLQSAPYRFYDEKHGGGFWYGKHYASGQPRIGDPLHDHSHGATVRQCLRFYLMLEQGRLVSGPASARMKGIFATPELELADINFVAGLQGRDLSLIRKSGTWEDWHLDTARVEHGGRVYLVAGMVHHPRGQEYLAAAAAALDEHLCGAPANRPYTHKLILHETPKDFRDGTVHNGFAQSDPPGVLLACPAPTDASNETAEASYESAVIESDLLFNEVLLSWNVDSPPHAAFCVEARVGRRCDDTWSPYLYFGDWGDAVPSGERTTKSEHGAIDVDYFRSDERFDRVQYRVRATGRALPDGDASAGVKSRIARVGICLSDTTGRLTSVPRPPSAARPDASQWQRRIAVPYRTQATDHEEMAGRNCSPTSVSMMMCYRGVDRSKEEVAERSYDPTHRIYGNWPRAIQAAYAYGVPGYLARFSDWTEVERMIASGQPLIPSIRGEEGELTGAHYAPTGGHLLVLTGFDANGNVAFNDPAMRTADKGQTTYLRRDLENVWMRTKGGTAYVLLAPPETPTLPRKTVHASEEPLVDVSTIDPRIVIDLRYATEKNFTGQKLYPVARCLLRESVARRLKRVQDRLIRQGLYLKVYDAYRPLRSQRKMWAIMPDPDYVADPAKGSRHNRGAAVDVTLVDFHGRELEMPTPHDDFSPAAHRDFAGGSDVARRNRKTLSDAMAAEGFTGLPSEWWHFDAPDWKAYPLLDVALDEGDVGDVS